MPFDLNELKTLQFLVGGKEQKKDERGVIQEDTDKEKERHKIFLLQQQIKKAQLAVEDANKRPYVTPSNLDERRDLMHRLNGVGPAQPRTAASSQVPYASAASAAFSVPVLDGPLPESRQAGYERRIRYGLSNEERKEIEKAAANRPTEAQINQYLVSQGILLPSEVDDHEDGEDLGEEGGPEDLADALEDELSGVDDDLLLQSVRKEQIERDNEIQMAANERQKKELDSFLRKQAEKERVRLGGIPKPYRMKKLVVKDPIEEPVVVYPPVEVTSAVEIEDPEIKQAEEAIEQEAEERKRKHDREEAVLRAEQRLKLAKLVQTKADTPRSTKKFLGLF